MRIKFFVLLALLALVCACGSKGNPVPKETLRIPPPDWVDVKLGEDGVVISNSSSTYPIVVERTVSELGDLGFPIYERVTIVPPGGTYLDNDTERDVRYLYRFASAHNRYYAYSSPVTRVVSYRGPVQIDRLDYIIRRNELCLDLQLSASTSYAETLINGQRAEPAESGCYPLPLMTQILLVVVPYSESGTPGAAYSATITRGDDDTLLPPQNMRVLRRGDTVTLSWDAAPNATGYRVTVGNTFVDITETLISWKAEGCMEFSIQSVQNEDLSAAITAESCP